MKKTNKKTNKNSKKTIYQLHHISYEPEVTVKVTRAEHFYLTRLGWFKSFTKGFREAVKVLLGSKPITKEDL